MCVQHENYKNVKVESNSWNIYNLKCLTILRSN